jgi:hypothetical protein
VNDFKEPAALPESVLALMRDVGEEIKQPWLLNGQAIRFLLVHSGISMPPLLKQDST